jgi:hypothetical protein
VIAPASRSPRLEPALAALLQYGSWLASAVIALGLALAAADSAAGVRGVAVPSGAGVVTAGIVLFIALPILRVLLLLLLFVRRREYHLAAVAALVLAIIGLGLLFGRR